MSESSSQDYSFAQLFIWGTARGHVVGALARGLSTVSSFFVVFVLSVYQYGLYQLVLTAVAVSESFAVGLFDEIIANDLSRAFAAKRLGLAKRLFNEIFLVKALIGLVLFLALFLGAGVFAHYYGKDIADFIRIMSFLALIKVLRNAQGMFFGAIVSFVTFGVGIIQEALRLVMLFAFWWRGALTLREVLLITVFAAALILGYTTFFFIREYSRVFRGVKADGQWVLPQILRQFGHWIFLRYGISKAFKQMDTWLIRIFLNTEAVGLYTLTINLFVMIQSAMPLKMLSVLLPWEIKEKQRLLYLYRRGVKYFVWAGLLLALLSFFVVPKLVALFLPKYLPAMPLFRALTITLPLYGVYKFQKILLTVLREQKILAMRLVTEMAITAAVWIAALPVFGLFAAAIELMVTYIWRVVFFFLYMKKSHGLTVKLRHILYFSREDWEFFLRAWDELLHPWRWLRLIRARI